MKGPEWFDSWFESPWYMRLYRHRTEEEAREAVDLVTKIAGVPSGARVLDLCCGYGRHAMALAEHGYHVMGLDNSVYLIDRARELYAHPNVEYTVGDMRGPLPGAPFDAVVNFFTSFGYFDTDTENCKVFDAVRSSLTAGGHFLIDFLDADHVRANLNPESMSVLDGVTIVQERWIDEPFVYKRITVNNPCSYELEFDERVWLYSRVDLEKRLRAAGLEPLRVMGTYEGGQHTPGSKRCIIVAKAV